MEKLQVCFKNGIRFNEKQILSLIKLLKINDLYEFLEKKYFKNISDIILAEIFYKTIETRNIISLSDKYFPLFEKIYLSLHNKKNSTEKLQLKEQFTKALILRRNSSIS